MEELEDLGDFGIEGLGAVYPVDGDALALHAAEPCHLAFGEAADVGVKVFVHLVVGAFTTQVAGDMAVFQTIAQQAFLGYALVEQGLHLVDHAVLEAFAEADADALDDLLAGENCSRNSWCCSSSSANARHQMPRHSLLQILFLGHLSS